MKDYSPTQMPMRKEEVIYWTVFGGGTFELAAGGEGRVNLPGGNRIIVLWEEVNLLRDAGWLDAAEFVSEPTQWTRPTPNTPSTTNTMLLAVAAATACVVILFAFALHA